MSNRTLVITGGGGILGQAVAKAAKASGATVVLVDVADLAGRDDLHGDILKGGVDLTDAEATRTAFQAIAGETGGIDVLLNIAGGFCWQTVEEGDLDEWDRMYKMNTRTAATACKAALPFLKASANGRIVNVGAAGAVKADGGMGAYAASKAGVMRLTESLAEELKDGTVTVNAVLPSIIDTPTNREDMPDADFDAWVSPDDLAAVMLFLASPEARAVTGALVPVTGKV